MNNLEKGPSNSPETKAEPLSFERFIETMNNFYFFFHPYSGPMMAERNQAVKQCLAENPELRDLSNKIGRHIEKYMQNNINSLVDPDDPRSANHVNWHEGLEPIHEKLYRAYRLIRPYAQSDQEIKVNTQGK